MRPTTPDPPHRLTISGRNQPPHPSTSGAHLLPRGEKDFSLHLVFFLISFSPMNALFKALSHPVRRRIIEMLRQGPMASGDIAAAFDMSWPTVTGHLNALKDAGLVSPEREGASIRYRLAISAVEEAMAFLMDIAGTGRAANEEETS